MSYRSWYEEHAKKHKELVDKLAHLSDEDIIEYFDYENMKVKEPDFCILYSQNIKCHDMDDLNCYLCACPNFRVDETESFCSIDSKDGAKIESKGYTHQDCSKCLVPHKKGYIKKHFLKNWKSIMDKTFI